MRPFRAAFGWLYRLVAGLSPRTKTLLTYGVAAALFWYASRGISLAAILAGARRADLGLFLGATAAILLIWLFGETLVFSRLFTYFHGPTSFRETLVPTAVQYFLQVVNVALAHGAIILLMSRQKAVPVLTAACTLLFQAFVDIQVLVLMTLAGLLLTPSLPVRGMAWYLLAALALLWLASWLWMRGRPASALMRSLYDLPAMSTFRRARPREYARLFGLRAPIYAAQGVVLYLQLLAFHVHVPFGFVLALTPLILLVTSIPLTPAGLGSEQAAILLAFHSFATRADLLTLAIAISLTNVIFRLALGVAFVKPLVGFLRQPVPASRPDVPEPALPGGFGSRHRPDWREGPLPFRSSAHPASQDPGDEKS